jgi:hypothetical protein
MRELIETTLELSAVTVFLLVVFLLAGLYSGVI